MITIYDFFDPYDIDHIEAYHQLCQTGEWPKGFIPEGIEFTNVWQVELAQKLADAWVGYQLSLDVG